MKKFIAAVILIIMIFALLFILFGQGPPDNDKNTSEGWLDLSKFRAHLDELSLDYTIEYKDSSDPELINNLKDPENSALLIIGFDENLTDPEISAIRNFVSNGGKVVVADDHGFANELAISYGLEYKNFLLRAYEEYFDHNYTFTPLIVSLNNEEYNVILNDAIGLEILDESHITILGQSIYSSEERKYAVLDVNRNNIVDAFDIQGPIPIVVEYNDPSSDGKILFFSNTGIFTDKQWDVTSIDLKYLGNAYENSEFVEALIPYLLPNKRGHIIYDESKQLEVFSGHLMVYPES
ncbi:MAG: hypothetical protein KAJ51_12730 [Thermoplasmata archaeon]|nr:hypothetical protein [Thermoplasmata archaeon]